VRRPLLQLLIVADCFQRVSSGFFCYIRTFGAQVVASSAASALLSSLTPTAPGRQLFLYLHVSGRWRPSARRRCIMSSPFLASAFESSSCDYPESAAFLRDAIDRRQVDVTQGSPDKPALAGTLASFK